MGSGKVLNGVTVISSDGLKEEAIKLAVMPVFGILKHLFDVFRTFSPYINLSSHSGISDTFDLYNYIQSLLLINCIAGITKIFT
jgi:hypothetical protein